MAGVAFKDLHRNMRGTETALYPSVGLRTPGEVVEANFGAQPFVFEIEQFFRVCRNFQRSLWKHFGELSYICLPGGESQSMAFGKRDPVGISAPVVCHRPHKILTGSFKVTCLNSQHQ